MSDDGIDDGIKWHGPEDEYGQNLSPDEEHNSREGHQDLNHFFEGESIIPGGVPRINESYLGDDNILQMLADDHSGRPKASRNHSINNKKGSSKEKTRKKHSLSKNRVNGKDSYVMRNTFEDLSNRMMAKSILSAQSIQGSVRNIPTGAGLGERKPGLFKEPATLSNLDHILNSPPNLNIEKKDVRFQTTADCTAHSKGNHSQHLFHDYKQTKDQISHRKYGNAPIFTNLHIEKKDSPVAPKSHFELPLQMKTEVIRLRKTSEIDKNISDNTNSKRNLLAQDKGPVRILKNVECPVDNNPQSGEDKSGALPPRSTLKKRRTAATSKDISIHDTESPDKDKHQRRISGFSKGSLDKKHGNPPHHFKTIQEVLAQNNPNHLV